MPHQETLDDAKDNIYVEEPLVYIRLTNEKLLGPKRPTRSKDHIRCMLTGKFDAGLLEPHP